MLGVRCQVYATGYAVKADDTKKDEKQVRFTRH